MPWIVGLDEAGYGPNLGPLVQAAVAVRAPDDGCLWARLAAAVRRAAGPDDGRLVIDDSKLVYAGPAGLARLERGALAALHCACHGVSEFGHLLNAIAGPPRPLPVESEPWYCPADCAPVADDPAGLHAARDQFAATLPSAGVVLETVRCVITPAPRFNALLDRWDSKAAVLADGVITLLGDILPSLTGEDAVTFLIDKQGGRNYYAAMVQTAFPAQWVKAVRESAGLSEYHIDGLGRNVGLVFRPRAEQAALPVALASMLAKYLREVLMGQFNRFWQKHVPGLEPTAGYPGDARRFYEAIRPAMVRLGMPESAVWRRK
jgi:ribonuclease HII